MSFQFLDSNTLESFFASHELLLIDGYTLQKVAFAKIFDTTLKPILKKQKKRICAPQDIVNKLKQNEKIYKKYFAIQTYIIEMHGHRNIPEALQHNKDKKILVIAGHTTTGNQVIKYKQKALFFNAKGFSEFEAQKDSKTKRQKATHISKGNATIKGALPKEQEKVFYNDKNGKKEILLTKELAKGGEGIIYETNTPYIAKIYKHDEHDTTKLKIPAYTLQKLKKLTKIKLKDSYKKSIFLPLHILYNSHNECVGFLMEVANGKPMQYILGGTKERAKHYPNCNYKDLVAMCINFLKLNIELHKKGIIIGDINTNNVLFDTNNTISLIDCDSFQIDEFPCPVTTEAFLHPSHRGKNMKDFMRNKADEYYAIAIFLFSVLHLGIHPYNCKGSDRDRAQKEMQFPYQLENTANNVPKNGQKYWEKLSKEMRELFYHTFQESGKYADEEKILDSQSWLKEFEKFYKSL